ncbi:glycoside hydrolase family 20 zincin-like fold domain-containing protein [Pedobacter heparinus]|uniref:glycoside hydrolase family 20 zincin-like fold domain-containing protein n=1 Tax=Pedobacter heparinus TaxID=984 RepID=UPI00292F2637|nr:glycoside hydrolase family 20 zincin-like fold domain-containing protein [Pedobacter heparinus]
MNLTIRKNIICRSLGFLVLFNLLCFKGHANTRDRPLIYPIPQEVKLTEGRFILDESTFIILREKPDAADEFLARSLAYELADKYGFPIKTVKKTSYNLKDKFLLIGSLANPLVNAYCNKNGLTPALKKLGEEGYILAVSGNTVVVAANSKNGAFMGLSSLRQLITKENNKISIPGIMVKDSPKYAFRGIKLYLPGKENIQFFKRFIKDFAVLYKYNKIILELNANMRLDLHPELNIGAVAFNKYLNYSRIDRPPGKHREFQDSSHQDNADGGILEKADVADLVSYMREFNMEVIPELPSLTHAYYLLSGHKELAENPEQTYPDTYCPLKPKIYDIYFDVLDEYIEVIKPAMIHVGHDEWRVEKDVCNLCRGKDYGELYAGDLNKIHAYLAKRGIKTAIWGDHLLESVTSKGFQEWTSLTGYKYKIPGALTLEQVKQLIPKDILIFNWFFTDIKNDQQVADFGFKQVYGNFHPLISNWQDRAKIKGILGGAPSSWSATTPLNMNKDLMFDIFADANLLWSKSYLSPNQLSTMMEPLVAETYKNLSGKTLPSDDGAKVSPVDISRLYNSSLTKGTDSLGQKLLQGRVSSGNRTFDLKPADDQAGIAMVVSSQKAEARPSLKGIPINKDVSSLLFLHASAKEAGNRKGYYSQYNFDDTAELLGWYEIVFEDGFVETVPIRYAVNILDWNLNKRIKKDKMTENTSTHAYQAVAVDCSAAGDTSVTFFAFEWKNTRFRKKIKEVRLCGVNEKEKGNAIVLLALSIAENPKVTEAIGLEAH